VPGNLCKSTQIHFLDHLHFDDIKVAIFVALYSHRQNYAISRNDLSVILRKSLQSNIENQSR
jgi:hypothetical protein